MTSEVKIHLEYEVEDDSLMPKERDFKVRPGEAPAVFSNYDTDPHSQFVIRNIGRSAIVERTPILPPGVKSLERESLAELTPNNPTESYPLMTAMSQRAELVITFVPDAPSA